MGNPGSNVRSGFHALAQAGADARSGAAAAPMGRWRPVLVAPTMDDAK